MDFGRSEDPRVQAQLDRLSQLSVPQGRLGLETIRALLDRLGNPHRLLPPVFHVAGTNGKGSVCAFLRAMLEADGKRVHVTTSPHLVRYNERIRLAGKLISNSDLALILEEVLDAGSDLGPSFFEVTIASAFLAFSRKPADACVVEVGLGGRFDATNVLEPDVLAACGIAALGLDHERFLLAPEDGVPKEPMARIAFEKAGIAKRGVPLVTQCYDDTVHAAVANQAERAGAILRNERRWWNFSIAAEKRVGYRDESGALFLPPPSLPGVHQYGNCALAASMIRHQSRIQIPSVALQQGASSAVWPARMQQLLDGPLVKNRSVWLDGGHNPSAGKAIAGHFDGPVHLVIGMLANKNPNALIEPLAGRILSLAVVPVSHHECHEASAFGPNAIAESSITQALLNLPDDGHPVLIAGSLYLAGEVLKLNHQVPD